MFKRRKNQSRQSGDNPLASRVVRGDDRPTTPLEGDEASATNAPQDEHDVVTNTHPGKPETPVRSKRPAGDRGVNPMEEPPTRIVNPSDPETTHPSEGLTRPLADLPVGALLILEGPGRGALLAVNPGVSDLGRGQGARLRLDFGDERIARDRHAVITYDPLGRRFFVQHGGGDNLTWVDGEPVLEPRTLPDGARLRVGVTELLFRDLLPPENHENAPAEP